MARPVLLKICDRPSDYLADETLTWLFKQLLNYSSSIAEYGTGFVLDVFGMISVCAPKQKFFILRGVEQGRKRPDINHPIGFDSELAWL